MMEEMKMESCDKHPSRIANDKCASCGAKLCDECISDRRGDIVLCYECAMKATTSDFERWEKEKTVKAEIQKAKIKKPRKEGVSGFSLFLIASLFIIALEGGVIIADYFVLRSEDVSYISSNTIKERSMLDLSVQNLHMISMAIESYKKDHGGILPEDLKALVPDYLSSIPVDPFTDLDYEYLFEDDNYNIICLKPEVYGMRYLKSINGKIYYMKFEEQ